MDVTDKHILISLPEAQKILDLTGEDLTTLIESGRLSVMNLIGSETASRADGSYEHVVPVGLTARSRRGILLADLDTFMASPAYKELTEKQQREQEGDRHERIAYERYLQTYARHLQAFKTAREQIEAEQGGELDQSDPATIRRWYDLAAANYLLTMCGLEGLDECAPATTDDAPEAAGKSRNRGRPTKPKKRAAVS